MAALLSSAVWFQKAVIQQSLPSLQRDGRNAADLIFLGRFLCFLFNCSVMFGGLSQSVKHNP